MYKSLELPINKMSKSNICDVTPKMNKKVEFSSKWKHEFWGIVIFTLLCCHRRVRVQERVRVRQHVHVRQHGHVATIPCRSRHEIVSPELPGTP